MMTQDETMASALVAEGKAEMTEAAAATGKPALLGREHDVSAFCSDDPTRLVIQGIHYNQKAGCIEACNGRVLIRVPVTFDPSEFPPVADTQAAHDCIIPQAAFKRALGNLPKTTKLPVLQQIRLGVNGTHCTLTTTDLETEQAIKTKMVEGGYPNIEQVIPSNAPKFSISLSSEILKRVAEYALKHGVDGIEQNRIRFDFHGECEPVQFSILLKDKVTKASGVMAPMRTA